MKDFMCKLPEVSVKVLAQLVCSPTRLIFGNAEVSKKAENSRSLNQASKAASRERPKPSGLLKHVWLGFPSRYPCLEPTHPILPAALLCSVEPSSA